MLRHTIVVAAIALLAQAAQAEQAGKIVFVAGQAKIAEQAAVLGAAVEEGQMLTTGDDGYIYVKTVDNGLFILRPKTQARIVTYHIDAQNPANTRIKLELLSGVARSRSGEAVKLARQNFRFNTPVAAIGVRGTDFAVFTDQNTSRVTVISGGITVSGFAGSCSPDGFGPCEGKAARELSAAQRGLLLQVQRDQAAPQLLQGGALAPDTVAPPRTDEPVAKSGPAPSAPTTLPSLDAQKSNVVVTNIAQNTPAPTTPVTPPVTTPPPEVVTVDPTPPVVTPPVTPPVTTTPDPVVTPPVATLPERQLVWGRWTSVLNQPAKLTLAGEGGNERVQVLGNYVVFLTPGEPYKSPEHGSIGFALKDSEAYIYTANKPTTVAQVQNGQLNVDFGSASFSTNFDLVSSSNETFKLKANGVVSSDGRLFGDSVFKAPTNMNVGGALSTANGGSAAYVFQTRLDAMRTTDGVTYWGR